MKAGFTAILRIKRRRQFLIYRMCSICFSAPFLARLLFALVMSLIGRAEEVSIRWTDILFGLILLIGIWLWQVPKQQVKNSVERMKDQMDLNAVNQYTFFPDHMQMLTTSSLEKFELDYENLTWVQSDSRWIVLYFVDMNFTMLVDRNGFTKGSSEDCLTFLRRKIGRQMEESNWRYKILLFLYLLLFALTGI